MGAGPPKTPAQYLMGAQPHRISPSTGGGLGGAGMVAVQIGVTAAASQRRHEFHTLAGLVWPEACAIEVTQSPKRIDTSLA